MLAARLRIRYMKTMNNSNNKKKIERFGLSAKAFENTFQSQDASLTLHGA